MPSTLKEWQHYLEQEVAAYCFLSDELNKLLQPWAPVFPLTTPTDNIDVKETTDQSAGHEVPCENGLLKDVKMGLEKASRARQRAVKNLLPEVEYNQTATGQVDGDETRNDFSVVSSSVLQDLIAKHCKVTDSDERTKPAKKPTSGKEQGGKHKEQINGHRTNIRPTTGKLKSVVRSAAGSQQSVSAQGKPSLKGTRTNLYKTSASDIGKGVNTIRKNKKLSGNLVRTQRAVSTSTTRQGGDSRKSGNKHQASHGQQNDIHRKRQSNTMGLSQGTLSADKKVGYREEHSVLIDDSPRETDGVRRGKPLSADGYIGDKRVQSTGVEECPGESRDFGSGKVESCGKNAVSGSTSVMGKSSRSSDELFDLTKDGKNIEVPVALKKLMSSNRKWKSKIMKKSSSQHASVFMSRLNQPLGMDTSTLNVIEIDKQYDQCSTKILEISREFSSFEESGNQLSPEQLAAYDATLREIQLMLNSLNDLTLHKLHRTGGSETSDVTTSYRPHTTLQYRDLKQLEAYTDLQLRMRLLEYTHQLEQELAFNLLALIRGHQGTVSSRLRRKMEGLLCHGAELFPSMVKCSDDHAEDP